MNVEIGAEAALLPEEIHKWDFRCSVGRKYCRASQENITINVPVVLMARYVMIFDWKSRDRRIEPHLCCLVCSRHGMGVCYWYIVKYITYVLLPSHHLQVHNIFHYVPVTPPPPHQQPFFRTFKKSTAPYKVHNMGLRYIKRLTYSFKLLPKTKKKEKELDRSL
jgi:hypothetical protein